MGAVILDFESQSLADLKRVGGRNYWAHASTRALCCAWYDLSSGASGIWAAGDAQPQATVDAVCIAHNAMGFDRFAAERLRWRVDAWIDSSYLARTLGYAGALDALGGEKDSNASRYTTSLSTPKRPPHIKPDEWRELSMPEKRERGDLLPFARIDWGRIAAYCESDVAIVAKHWPELATALDLEPDVVAVSDAVNDRGVAFDSELATRLLECIAANTDRAVSEAARALGVSAERARAIATSPAQYACFAKAPNAQSATVEEHMRSDDPQVRAIANARQHVASIARGKLEAGLARVSPDGRLRDTHQYYGAHTGRWSGRGMQLQNMPRPSKRFEDWTGEDINRLAEKVLGGYTATPEEIDLLLRACLVASEGRDLLVLDYKSIEARGLAWLANDGEALAVFVSGRDPYKAVAAKMFGCGYDDITKEQRHLGKIVELACGYGMGPHKFSGTTGADPKLVALWREARPAVLGLWHDLEDAWSLGKRLGPLRFERYGAHMRLRLPSGRTLFYRDVPSRPRSFIPGSPVENVLEYRGTRFPLEHTYGGKLAENAVQALCRDLLADALVKAERAGLQPVMHVHDEIVCEVPRGTPLVELERIMLDAPAWSGGLPVACDGYVARRYRK